MAEITSLPPKSDPRWRDIATGKLTKPWQSLALKIMITRIGSSVKADPSDANTQKGADEIYDFFAKNMKIAQADLQSIFG